LKNQSITKFYFGFFLYTKKMYIYIYIYIYIILFKCINNVTLKYIICIVEDMDISDQQKYEILYYIGVTDIIMNVKNNNHQML